MAEPRIPGPDPTATPDVPLGLLEELSRPGDEVVRAFEVARCRQRAVERAFDDGDVVHEIASRLLVLSTPA
jgi:hypothetical protein